MFKRPLSPARSIFCLFFYVLAFHSLASAQTNRIRERINTAQFNPLRGNIHPLARPANDRGPADKARILRHITINFKPDTTQQADLDQLLEQQQDPSSPNFHVWLTPEQFGDRFGLSEADLSAVIAWVEAAGFRVTATSAARNWVAFDGSVEVAERALHTEIRNYQVNSELHFANASEPSVPSAIAPLVTAITGLNDFRMKPATHQIKVMARDSPEFTNGTSHVLTPDDYATIYDIRPLYNGGFDGSNQKLAIVGQTDISLSDIASFRSLTLLPPIKLQQILVPGTTDPGHISEDEGEADLDLEWSGAVARNANIIYIYAPNVLDAVQYALNPPRGIAVPAPVVSMSYGACEARSGNILLAWRALVQQGNSQGVTLIASTGDAGAAGCDRQDESPFATGGLAVQVPASIPEVTAVGGTQFNEGNGVFWSSVNSAGGGSALTYIPEKGWNESGSDGLASSTGGFSVFYPRPSWQSAPGMPASIFRLVPDIALAAAAGHDGYLWVSSTNSQCASASSYCAIGGTSAAAPAFAGMVALLNQYAVTRGAPLTNGGQGNLNPVLYRLYSSAPNAFHDVISGSNIVNCAPGTLNCSSGAYGYLAGQGYDLVTGLGSIDANNLITQWYGKSATSTTTTISANPSAFTTNTSTTLTARVTGTGGTPTGSISFLAGGKPLGSVALTGGAASLPVSGGQFSVGNTTVAAIYSGDSNFGGSSGSTVITVSLPVANSSVVPSVTPSSVPLQPPDANGYTWFYKVSLTETAGTPTTLTSFTIGGSDYSAQITNFFGSSRILAKGALSSSLGSKGYPAPSTLALVFGGVDDNGQKWSQSTSVTLLAAQVGAAIALASAPTTVYRNPADSASCQWYQNLVVQELNGFPVTLTRFLAGGHDLSSQIDIYFGSTSLTALGTLQAGLCWSGISPPETLSFEVDGVDSSGNTIKASDSVTFQSAPSTVTSLSLSKNSAALQVASSAQSTSTTINVNVRAGVAWSVTTFPANKTSSWLVVFPTAGSGPGTVTLTGYGTGLSNGAYQALVSFQAPQSVPSFVDVPVSLSVGSAPSDWNRLGGTINGKPAIAINSDGRLEVAAAQTDGALLDIAQTSPGGNWGPWSSPGGFMIGSPSEATNTNGRVEAFIRGGDNGLWYISQNSAGSALGGFGTLGGVIITPPAVATNADGRLEVFAIGGDNALWHVWQTTPGGAWSGWATLGGSLTGSPAIARNSDGRLEVFVRGADSSLWHIWQSAPGSSSWSEWSWLGGALIGTPSVTTNQDGRLEAFVRGGDNGLWYIAQSFAGSTAWSGWGTLGGIATADPAVAVNYDGRLEAFVRGGDNSLWHIAQASPGGQWSSWGTLGGGLSGPPSPIVDSTRRIKVFIQGGDNSLWYISQTSPGSWN